MYKLSEIIIRAIPATFIVICTLLLLWWIVSDPTADFTLSEPGMDDYAEAEPGVEEEVIIGEFFQSFPGAGVPELEETWTRFRGERSDNIYSGSVPLKESFGSGSVDLLWSVEMGEGHAGAAIFEGLVYVLDYDEELRADMLRCFSLTTGEEVWRRWYEVEIRRNHGMSRTVPAVTEEFILTIGPRGHVMCVERESGDFLWGLDIVREYDSEIPLWYTGQCPLIYEGVAIIATGGSSLMIGIDCMSGEVLWETPNPDGWEMSHSSVIPYEFGGRKMFLYSAVGGVAGIAADGEDAGSVLWSSSEWSRPVVAASPVGTPDGKIFLTAGYGAGSMLLQLSVDNGSYSIDILESYRPGGGLSSEQQTPILADGHLFGILPNDARAMRNQFVCVHPDDPTEIIWSSGPTARFGLGPYILADDRFYLLNDDASLYIIEKSTEAYNELDNIQLFEGYDAWAPLAIADGYMVLRDDRTMVCIDLRR